MSTPRLPGELLDHIADNHLQGLEVFRNCCLVSKSWVPRTRRKLFEKVVFDSVEKIRSWKETFPDSSTSPARYADAVFFKCLQTAGANVEAGDWITDFSRVVHLGVTAFESCTTVNLPCSIHLILTTIEPLRMNRSHRPLLAHRQPHILLPSSRGFDRDDRLERVGRRWSRSATNRPQIHPTHDRMS